jgi:hypothetical protein
MITNRVGRDQQVKKPWPVWRMSSMFQILTLKRFQWPAARWGTYVTLAGSRTAGHDRRVWYRIYQEESVNRSQMEVRQL